MSEALAIASIEIECKGDAADVLIYDQIGRSYFDDSGLTAKAFAENLKALGKGIKTINVRINSPGGSVFDGTAIYNTLRNHGAKVVVHVEGAALSIASIIAMAGDEIHMASNAYMMIHDPMSVARGRSDEMRRVADMLDKMKGTLVATYAQRTKQSAEEIARLMSEETWLSAEEAVAKGFADSITGESKVIASFDLSGFSNVPSDLVNSVIVKEVQMSKTTNEVEQGTPKAATFAEIKAAFPQASAEWREKQLEANATLAQATSAFIAYQSEQIAAANKAREEAESACAAAEKAKAEADKAKADAEASAKSPKPGNQPIVSAGKKAKDATAEEVSDFADAVAANIQAGMDRRAATIAAAKANPDAHRAFLESTNTGRRQRELIADRFGN